MRRRCASSRAEALPTVARLADETETGLVAAMGGDSDPVPGCLLVTVYEGTAEHVAARHGEASALLSDAGGVSLGADPAASWERGRFHGPYVRDSLLEANALAETLETATTWSHVDTTHSRVREALDGALRDQGAPPIVMCHISHIYPTGASLYFTVACAQGAEPAERWRLAKRAATDAITECGATITHHHAVGLEHRDWMSEEVGALRIEVLRSVKAALDPQAILTRESSSRVPDGTPAKGAARAPRHHLADQPCLGARTRGPRGQGGGAPPARGRHHHHRATGGSRDDTLELAHRAVSSGTDALVTCGGDGIAHLAVQAVAGTSTPFGLVSTGTGNDFARMLGLPLGDPVAAARVVSTGAVRPIDLARVGRRWFGTVLAGGFDAKVSDRTNRMRWPRGKARYNLAVLAELGKLRPRDYVLELDGHRERVRAVLVAVGNGSSYGGGMHICPSARLDDGLLDVTVIGAAPRGRLVRLLPTVYSGSHLRRPEVRTFRAHCVRLSTTDVTSYADGEPFAPLPLTAECVPGAALALAPPR